MAVGLIALLDDIAAIAKVAAASLDDVASQAAKASVKAAGVVIDDAAVTPRYVVGFAAERELPIVWRIALGSLKNKLLFLLPAALALSWLAPWTITPLLMIGGAYLCYEGAEKVYEALFPLKAQEHEKAVGAAGDAAALEKQKISGAIKTDFILSAEIMAITLAALPADASFWNKAAVLGVVGLFITIGVYGVVALIVKADDAGVAMTKTASRSAFGAVVRGLGRALVVGMPVFLKILAIVGTAAMIWVGGGIIVHGLAQYGFAQIEEALHHASEAVSNALPALGGLAGWLTTAAGSGVVGLTVGALAIPLASYVLGPAWSALGGLFGRTSAATASSVGSDRP